MRKWIKSSYSPRYFVFFAFLFVLFTLSGVLCAQEAEEKTALPPFEEVVSEDYTLDKLYIKVKNGQVSDIPKDKYIMIEGVVSSRQIIQQDEENFFGILEISSGSWEQGEDLEMYRCYFQLRGSEFHGTIPEGRSRETSPKEIPLHSHLIAVGTYLGYGEDAEGNRYPVLQAVNIRRLRM
jgi:hypothetical protein